MGGAKVMEKSMVEPPLRTPSSGSILKAESTSWILSDGMGTSSIPSGSLALMYGFTTIQLYCKSTFLYKDRNEGILQQMIGWLNKYPDKLTKYLYHHHHHAVLIPMLLSFKITKNKAKITGKQILKKKKSTTEFL